MSHDPLHSPAFFDSSTSSHVGTIRHTHRDVSRSTNSELIDAMQTGALPCTLPHLLTASAQTSGRGQHGRSWMSPVGGVYLSLYLPITRPNTDPALGTPCLHYLSGSLSLVVGYHIWQLPIIRAINDARGAQGLPLVQVKWANDLGYYQHDTPTLINHTNANDSANSIATVPFFKLVGILIEPVLMAGKMVGAVMGVGLNVATSPTIHDGLYQAASLSDLVADLADTDLTDARPTLPAVPELYLPLCQALCSAARDYNSTYHDKRLSAQFVHDFNSAHALHGLPVGMYVQDSTDIPASTGNCVGIGADGTLLLDGADGVQAVFTGMAKRLITLP